MIILPCLFVAHFICCNIALEWFGRPVRDFVYHISKYLAITGTEKSRTSVVKASHRKGSIFLRFLTLLLLAMPVIAGASVCQTKHWVSSLGSSIFFSICFTICISCFPFPGH